MGIQGLIPFVEKASTEINIKNIAGASVAVDSYCWLHKGAFSCADKIIRGEHTDLYVKYCLKYIEMLLSYRINIVMVFDGCHLPAKRETEKKRFEIRKEARLMAQQCLRDNDVQRARSYMRRAIDITHEMALNLIKECRKRGIDCIVAPYEADAQMAWLSKVNLVEYIITEDSDLLLFGAQKILFKLDLEGRALLVDAVKLPLTMGCKPQRYCFEKFRRMCILSGCDYLDSLPGVGLKKACKFMLTTEEDDMTRALKKLPQYLNMRNLNVTDEYIEEFLKAEATFRHMYIYNSLKRKMERLNELIVFNTNEKYCTNAGELFLDEQQAFQLALGNLNPFNLIIVDNWHPDNAATSWAATKKIQYQSIWQKSKVTKIDSNEQVEPSNLHYKAILYKHMHNTEAQETNKLDEEEINALYRSELENVNKKRKRSLDVEESEYIINGMKVPSNASAHVTSPNKLNDSKSSKLKSPEQTKQFAAAAQSKIEVRSRFFIANHKVVNNNRSSKRSESILDLIDIEEASKNMLNRQQQLYAIATTSPQLLPIENTEKCNLLDNNCSANPSEENKPTEQLSCKDSPSLISNRNTNLATSLKDDFTQITDNEIMISHTNRQLKLPLINFDATNKKIRRLGLSTPMKKIVDNHLQNSHSAKTTETKQLTLSQFNFQKRTILKKS